MQATRHSYHEYTGHPSSLAVTIPPYAIHPLFSSLPHLYVCPDPFVIFWHELTPPFTLPFILHVPRTHVCALDSRVDFASKLVPLCTFLLLFAAQAHPTRRGEPRPRPSFTPLLIIMVARKRTRVEARAGTLRSAHDVVCLCGSCLCGVRPSCLL